MSTPPGRPEDPGSTVEFDRPATMAPTPEKTVIRDEPAAGTDPGGATVNFPSLNSPDAGQNTLEMPDPGDLRELVSDTNVQGTGMWASRADMDAEFSLSSKAGVVVDPKARGEVERLADAPQVPGYEILGELGRGAMGVVYKARQVGLKRVVALKMILSGGHASNTEIVRFRVEAEAVARLQHPNIVQVFEIGEHRGLPYFSLEFVDGGCLADKLADNPLKDRDAADLARQLALAMAVAHEQGIVHRDLKPANVLMTRDGVPKITDFGLAKKLEEDSGATRAGSIMGTPSYMAPEQAEGRQDLVGPHSDIYALGAILYDLLTGRPPFRGTTVLETLTQVRLLDPVPPARLMPQMPRDLETITLKCLEKEAKRRYASARDLAEDLRRFLAGEPIQARAVSNVERAWKWTKRHPAAAGLAAVSVLSLVGLGVGGLAFAGVANRNAKEQTRLRVQAEEATKRAERNFQEARNAVEQMLVRVGNERLEYEPKMEQVRRDLLEKASAFFERFLKDSDGESPDVRHEAAVAARKLGDIRGYLGNAVGAEEAYRRSLELLEPLAAGDDGNAAYRQDLAATCINLANLLKKGKRFKDADASYAQAIAACQTLVEQDAADAGRRRELALAHYQRGLLEEEAARPADAVLSLRSALALQQKLAAESRLPADKQALAGTWTILGRLRAATRPQEAEEALREALLILDALTKEQPTNPAVRQELVVAANQMGALLRTRRPKDAGPLFERAVKLAQGLVDDYPTVPEYQQELAGSLTNLALWQLAAGQREKAVASDEAALRLVEKLAANFPKQPAFQLNLAKRRGDHGLLLRTNGQLADAARVLEQTVASLRALVKAFPGDAENARQLALALIRQASLTPGAGDDKLREALAIQDALVKGQPAAGAYQAERAQTRVALATALHYQNKHKEAEALYREAEADNRDLVKRFPEEPEYARSLAVGLINRADVDKAAGRAKEAEAAWAEAKGILGGLVKAYPDRPEYQTEYATALHNLAVLYLSVKRFGEAEKAARAAVGVRVKLAERFPEEWAYRQELAGSRGELAIALAQQNNLPASEAEFKLAQELLRQVYAADETRALAVYQLMNVTDNYANLLHGLGRDDDAVKQWRDRVALLDALATRQPTAAAPRSDVGRALHDLAGRQVEYRRLDDARTTFAAALKAQRQALKLAPKDAAVLANLGAHGLGLADAWLADKDHAQAAKAVAAVVVDMAADWPQYPAAAAVLGRCAAAALADKLPEAKRKELATAYGDRAVELLRKAKAAGFRDAEAVRKAKEFAPLLDREDVRLLLQEMAKSK